MTYMTRLTGRNAPFNSRITMLVVAGMMLVLALSSTVHAQWTNGTNINNTNSGSVGIGTTSLANGKLVVQTASGTTPAIARFEQLQTTNDRGGYLGFGGGSDGTTAKGYIGFGRVGTGGITLFSNELSNSFGIRSENALHLGTGGGNIRLTIDSAGNVGIGTVNPGRPLVVAADANGIPLRVYRNGNFVGWGTGIEWALNNSSGNLVNYAYVNSTIVSNTAGAENGTLGFSTVKAGTLTQQAILDQNGNLGIGIASPSSRTHLYINDLATGGSGDFTNETSNILTLEAGATASFPRVIHKSGSATVGAVYSFQTTKDAYWGEATDSGRYRFRGRDLIVENGKLGIGVPSPTEKLELSGNIKLTGTGSINASGTITGANIIAKYQDVAEWVESSQALAAGTVVVLDQTRSNQVIASSRAYDTRVAGVISLQPGITLGENGEGKVLVATTGRVKIKVDASRGSIQVGDLLVTSDVAGLAMKSQPLDLGGVQIHRPGTLIGKALEPLAKGTGEILVLLSLQ